MTDLSALQSQFLARNDPSRLEPVERADHQVERHSERKAGGRIAEHVALGKAAMDADA